MQQVRCDSVLAFQAICFAWCCFFMWATSRHDLDHFSLEDLLSANEDLHSNQSLTEQNIFHQTTRREVEDNIQYKYVYNAYIMAEEHIISGVWVILRQCQTLRQIFKLPDKKSGDKLTHKLNLILDIIFLMEKKSGWVWPIFPLQNFHRSTHGAAIRSRYPPTKFTNRYQRIYLYTI